MKRQIESLPDFPAKERDRLKKWHEDGTVDAYLHKNDASQTCFSFLDGPITANNPMGVHHAWGRTYKDIWQKFHNLLGHKQRFQNGFDCQGLWVEVEVEKELGIKNKKEIENLVPGDREASIAHFVGLCRERVLKFATVQTTQTQRLGNFMDWDNSYFTMSDENNYMIWHFLKRCFEHGWIYKGQDAVPWCPRCETAISQHEMLTEDYKEATHEAIFVRFPITDEGWDRTSLLVWTTTPWSMVADVAVGVHPSFTYGVWESDDGDKVIFLDANAEGATPIRKVKKREMPIQDYVFFGVDKQYKKTSTLKGSELLGIHYAMPYADLPIQKEAGKKNRQLHTVVDASDLVNEHEGTGMLHIATGAGTDDFRLGKKLGLPVISVIGDDASYLDGLSEFSGKNAKAHPELIIDDLRSREGIMWLFRTEHYTHRYPACWRCKKELVWKVTEEWYIAMDRVSSISKKTFREMMQKNAKDITWLPSFGLERELDWLEHMDDWLISKKNRYWGLALPIYECESCRTFTVIGSRTELQERARNGWDVFEGHTPHKPYIDAVTISCTECRQEMRRVDDVGNVWLDAGIVPYSTIAENNMGEPLYLKDKQAWEQWFPVDFITESFPGQFKNWFYALIAMSTALEDTAPFKTVLGFGTLLAEDGRPMHKSWGNSIEFNEGADAIGVDVMRWMYARSAPSENMLFGYKIGDEVRRSFLLMLWNVYKFYCEYTELDAFAYKATDKVNMTVLDAWALARARSTSQLVQSALHMYDARAAAYAIEALVRDISTWYIRRSRNRVWTASDNVHDKAAFYTTLREILVTIAVISSPMMPFITDEIYTELTGEKSVHLSTWPQSATSRSDEEIIEHMAEVRQVIEAGHRARKEVKVRVRQPLATVQYSIPERVAKWYRSPSADEYISMIADELNVKKVIVTIGTHDDIQATYDSTLTKDLEDEGFVRELIRSVQHMRQQQGLHPSEVISLTIPALPDGYESYVKKRVLAHTVSYGKEIVIRVIPKV